MAQVRRKGGSFRTRERNIANINTANMHNPWNFFHLFMQDDDVVQSWMREQNLLATHIRCSICNDGTVCSLRKRSKATDGVSFRCPVNPSHEYSMRKFTWFEKSQLRIQDIMLFNQKYLEGCTLKQCSLDSGIAYKSTAVDWASFVRELFKENFARNIKELQLSGEIELDESLFGRKVKYHRGNPTVGTKVWVFGMVERATNRIILYPVDTRDAATLIPLIRKHVAPGSEIYSDGWSSYCNLNELGFSHFTVLHNYAFKKVYVNKRTQERKYVHTNRIEGSWKHSKDYFRRMSGTKRTQFEGHIAEIMFRNQVACSGGGMTSQFYDLLRDVYTLEAPPSYTYTTPLFSTWTMDDSVDTDTQSTTVVPILSDFDISDDVYNRSTDEDISNGVERISISSTGEMNPSTEHGRSVRHRNTSPIDSPNIRSLFHTPSVSSSDPLCDLFGSSPDDDIADCDRTIVPQTQLPTHVSVEPVASTSHFVHYAQSEQSSLSSPSLQPAQVTPRRKKKRVKYTGKSSHVCCPDAYTQEEDEGGRSKRHSKTARETAYGKSSFHWGEWSDDSDFA